MEGFWRDTSIDDVEFFACPEGFCLEEEMLERVEFEVLRLNSDPSFVVTSLDAGSTLCTVLHNDSFCIAPERNPNCRMGHTGPACSLCIPGYTLQNGFCGQCPPGSAISQWGLGPQVAVGTVGGALVVTFLVITVWLPILPGVRAFVMRLVESALALVEKVKTTSQRLLPAKTTTEADGPKTSMQKKLAKLNASIARHFGELFVCIMMVVSSFQIISSFKETLAVPWPNVYEAFAPALSASNIKLFNIPGIACLVPSLQFYKYEEVLALFAIVVVCTMIMSWFAGLFIALRRGTFRRSEIIKYTRRFFIIMLALVDFLYLPLTETVYATFSCTRLGSTSYLSDDVSAQCGTASHAKWVAIGAFFFVLFPVGIPVLYFNTLLFYHVPYLCKLKCDVEYLRRLIDVMARENKPLDTDHEELMLDTLEPRHLDALWMRFAKNAEVRSLPDGSFEIHIEEEDEEEKNSNGKEAVTAAVPSAKFKKAPSSLTSSSDDGQQSSPRARVSPIASIAAALREAWGRYLDRVYGVRPPTSVTEFKVQQLVAYSREHYTIERMNWEKKFPREREQQMQAIAAQACGFLFEEYEVNAWGFELLEISKDAVISSVIRFVRPGSAVQVMMGLLIVYVYHQVYIAINPFMEKPLATVAYLEYLSLFGFFFLGTILINNSPILKMPEHDHFIKMVLTLILFLAVIVVPVLLSIHTFYRKVYADVFAPNLNSIGEEDEEPVHHHKRGRNMRAMGGHGHSEANAHARDEGNSDSADSPGDPIVRTWADLWRDAEEDSDVSKTRSVAAEAMAPQPAPRRRNADLIRAERYARMSITDQKQRRRQRALAAQIPETQVGSEGQKKSSDEDHPLAPISGAVTAAAAHFGSWVHSIFTPPPPLPPPPPPSQQQRRQKPAVSRDSSLQNQARPAQASPPPPQQQQQQRRRASESAGVPQEVRLQRTSSMPAQPSLDNRPRPQLSFEWKPNGDGPLSGYVPPTRPAPLVPPRRRESEEGRSGDRAPRDRPRDSTLSPRRSLDRSDDPEVSSPTRRRGLAASASEGQR